MSIVLEHFIQSLADSGLMSADESRAFLNQLPTDQRPADGESLGQHLVAAGKLSSYQAKALRDGRLKDLCIGNYLVLDHIGAGGMGTVYKALHRRMRRVVAIKVLLRSFSENPTLLQRFQREVEAVAYLSHPNIVLAYDADESEAGHFLVMEFVDGSDFASIVQKHGPLPLSEAVDGLRQAAQALEYAHGRGIVHRDIKPANLLRDKSGVVKLADLGLARFNDLAASLTPVASDLTQVGSIAGTIDYMSPEQALDTKSADQRSDIYSLGCTLYYLVTGQVPYVCDTLMQRLLAHREGAIPSLRQARPDVPETLDCICRRMLAKRPEARFQTANDVIRALEACHLPVDDAVPTLNLPPQRPGPSATTDVPAKTMVMRGLTVLLVEPSRTQSVVIGNYLSSMGIQTLERAASGRQALEMLPAATPSVVVCTMHLPDMTGVQLVEQMRFDERFRRLPFILISSEVDYPRLDGIRDAGHVAILPKPFSIELLEWAIAVATDISLSSTSALTQINTDARVLIADDSVVARQRVRKVLAELGVTNLTEAMNGKQARDLLQSRSFDLVVSDYNMPELDGQELLRYIRQESQRRRLPVLMITSETDQDKLSAVEHLGVSALSNKNFDPTTIRGILATLLAKESPGSRP